MKCARAFASDDYDADYDDVVDNVDALANVDGRSAADPQHQQQPIVRTLIARQARPQRFQCSRPLWARVATWREVAFQPVLASIVCGDPCGLASPVAARVARRRSRRRPRLASNSLEHTVRLGFAAGP